MPAHFRRLDDDRTEFTEIANVTDKVVAKPASGYKIFYFPPHQAP